jgi:hypothetical protein
MALGEGAIADILVQNGGLAVKPPGTAKHDLADLVSQFTATNVRVETATGSAAGKAFR